MSGTGAFANPRRRLTNPPQPELKSRAAPVLGLPLHSPSTYLPRHDKHISANGRRCPDVPDNDGEASDAARMHGVREGQGPLPATASGGNACQRHRRSGDASGAWEPRAPPAPALRQHVLTSRRRLETVERKLDGLVTLLSATQPAADTSTPPTTTPPQTTATASPSAGSAYSAVAAAVLTPLPSPVFTLGLAGGGLALPGAALTFARADALLGVFRTHVAPHFPFVELPAAAGAQALRGTHPFLFTVVLSVSAVHELALQRALGDAVLAHVAAALLVHGGKSLELLQGLLLHVACGKGAFKEQIQRCYRLLQLAVALCVDLRLNERAHGFLSDLKRRIMAELAPGELAPLTAAPSVDEKRALLGVYYLSSAVATGFKKLQTFPWTPQLEAAAADPAMAPELVAMVRIQQHVEAPAVYPLGALPASQLLQLHYYHAKMRALEPYIERHDSVEALGTAVRFLDVFLAMPEAQLLATSFFEWMQVTYVLIMLLKVGMRDGARWAGEMAGGRDVGPVDIALYLRRVQECIEALEVASGESDSGNHLSTLVGRMRVWFDTQQPVDVPVPKSVVVSADVHVEKEKTGLFGLDGEEEAFWRDLFEGAAFLE
ncbi:hypothetical protein EDC01DRAFT_749188 [Geopyxis carbonaria]|nr:hypothetical protein EDC01DRAFT_749188 [Geopyxis carbonaria]